MRDLIDKIMSKFDKWHELDKKASEIKDNSIGNDQGDIFDGVGLIDKKILLISGEGGHDHSWIRDYMEIRNNRESLEDNWTVKEYTPHEIITFGDTHIGAVGTPLSLPPKEPHARIIVSESEKDVLIMRVGGRRNGKAYSIAKGEVLESKSKLSSKKLKKLWNEAKRHSKSNEEIKQLQQAYIEAKREGR